MSTALFFTVSVSAVTITGSVTESGSAYTANPAMQVNNGANYNGTGITLTSNGGYALQMIAGANATFTGGTMTRSGVGATILNSGTLRLENVYASGSITTGGVISMTTASGYLIISGGTFINYATSLSDMDSSALNITTSHTGSAAYIENAYLQGAITGLRNAPPGGGSTVLVGGTFAGNYYAGVSNSGILSSTNSCIVGGLYGLELRNNSQTAISGGTIAARNANGRAVEFLAIRDSRLTLNNVLVSATGAGAYGIYTGNDNNTAGTTFLTVSGGTIAAERGTGIYLANDNNNRNPLSITFTGDVTVSDSNGGIRSNGKNTTNITLSTGTLTLNNGAGGMTFSGSDLVNITATDSALTGYVRKSGAATANLTLNASAWNVLATSTLSALTVSDSRSALTVALTDTTARITADSAVLNGTLTVSGLDVSAVAKASDIPDTLYTIIHAGGGITGDFDTANIAGAADYLTLSGAKINGNTDYAATLTLSWFAPTDAAHGNYTLADGEAFEVDVTLSDTGANAVKNWDGKSLTKLGGGTLTLSATNDFTGATTVSGGELRVTGNLGNGDYAGAVTVSGGTLAFNQSGGQILAGTVSGSGVIIQQSTGTLTFGQAGNFAGRVVNETDFSMGGNDQAIGHLTNNGRVHFVNIGRTLTLGSLDGNGLGEFYMDIDIVGGTGDFIRVTGTADGQHRLIIKNHGTDPDGRDFWHPLAFNAAGDAVFSGTAGIGMFDYEVRHASTGTGTVWYLENVNDPEPPPVDPPVNPPVNPPQPPPTPGIVGKEVLIVPPSLGREWFEQIERVRNHLGELRGGAGLSLSGGILDSVWLKSYGAQVNVSPRVIGSGVREYEYGADAGVDQRWSWDADNTLIVGAFLGHGRLDRTLRDSFGSTSDSDNYHAGWYAVWLHECGLWADLIAKGQYYDNNISAWDASRNSTKIGYGTWGGGVTLDVGKKFSFADGWYVEPQIGAGYAHFLGENYRTGGDNIFDVSVSGADIFQFRAAVHFGRVIKLNNSGGILQPRVKIGGMEQVSSGGRVSASGATWRPNMDGPAAEIGAGVMWKLNGHHTLTLDYEASFGNKFDKPWGLTAGYRYQF